MPFTLFTRQKAAPLGISSNNFPADLYRAEPDFIPIQNAPVRRQEIINRDPARHISMAAEVFVCDGLSAALRDSDEDCSIQTAVKPHGPVPRITTTDSWLAGEYPSLYLKRADEEESDEESEELVSPMSSTDTLVGEPVLKVKAAHIAAKLEAIAAEVPRKPVAARTPTLISLANAQARADIKYRPEGFEMIERLQARHSETAWWKAY